MKKNKIAILIVSFNRRDYVLKNIEAIKNLNYKEYDVMLFDNGSSDGTIEAVERLHTHVLIYKSTENLGGAGGFAAGLRHAHELNYEYIWCLDDDGYPQHDALSMLVDEIKKTNSIAILGTRIIPITQNETKTVNFWPIHGKYDKKSKSIIKFSESDKHHIIKNNLSYETATVALLGMFISRKVIDKIGYPLKDLFISNDDVEYCLRAWLNDIPVILVQKSILFHPPNVLMKIVFMGKKLELAILAPWKLYYYVRNSIYISKKYFNYFVYFKFILMSILIIFYSVINNKASKISTLKAGILGLYHALIGKIEKYTLN